MTKDASVYKEICDELKIKPEEIPSIITTKRYLMSDLLFENIN